MSTFSPKAKILAYITLVIAVFISGSFKLHLVFLFLVILTAVRVPLSALKRGMIPVIFFLAFTFLSNLYFQEGDVLYEVFGLKVTDEGLRLGGRFTLRLFILILGAKVLTATTKAGDLVKGIGGLLGPVGRIDFVKELMVTMSLTLRLLPVIYDEALELYKNVKNSEGNGLTARIRLAVSLLAPLFERSLKKAKEMTELEQELEH